MFRDSHTGVVFHHGIMTRSPLVVRVVQVVNFLFGVLYALFATRFVLVYIEARGVGFVQMVTQWTEPLYRPFRGIVADGHDPGGHPIAWSIVVAVLAYALLHAGIVGLLRMISRPHAEA